MCWMVMPSPGAPTKRTVGGDQWDAQGAWCHDARLSAGHPRAALQSKGTVVVTAQGTLRNVRAAVHAQTFRCGLPQRQQPDYGGSPKQIRCSCGHGSPGRGPPPGCIDDASGSARPTNRPAGDLGQPPARQSLPPAADREVLNQIQPSRLACSSSLLAGWTTLPSAKSKPAITHTAASSRS